MRTRIRLLCVLLALLTAAPAAAGEVSAPATLPPPVQRAGLPTPMPTARRALALGDSGSDVTLLKERMRFLGYFSQEAELSSTVSAITMERLNQLLDDNGMGPVVMISAEVQDMILSRDDFAIIPTPTPRPSPQPIRAPAGLAELPALDAQGFMADTGAEYVFADAEDGLWYYISHTLYINIRRYHDMDAQHIWCEAEVKTRGNEGLMSFFASRREGRQTPVDIARDNRAVLAFSDDYYMTREYGVVVRDGVVYRDTIRKSSTLYPLGDTLAVFADGRMLASEYTAYTADALLSMGAVQVLSFGPWLVSNGEINPRLLTGEYMHYLEPRCALGMIEPGHYVVIAVDGRYDGAGGAYIEWLACRMRDIGVTEAVNLDGGGTTAMVFMGLQISRVASAKPNGAYTRKVGSLLGFGESEAVVNAGD